VVLSKFKFGSGSAGFTNDLSGVNQFGIDNLDGPEYVAPAPFAWNDAGSRPKGGTGGGSTSGTTGSSSVTSVTSASSSLKVNITWDASVGSAPSGFMAGVIAGVQYLESKFTDAVTLNINVGYGEVGGSSLGSGTLGSSQSYLMSFTYAQITAALKTDGTSGVDSSVLASLPAASPVTGTYWLTTAQAKALGLDSATATSADGNVGFSNSLPFTYNDASGVAAGTYDFNGTVLHELTEVMGRLLLTGGTIGTTTNSYGLMDLMHYAAPGVRDFSATTAGYFSTDGGSTNLGAFNTVAGGESGDWASSVLNNAFDAFAASGTVETISAADLAQVDALGWNPAQTPTGVLLAAATGALAAGQGSNGLNPNTALVRVVQTGDPSPDSFTYTLGGTGASSFTLTSAGNAATLAVGAAGVTGGTAGTLYALTVSATDTTSGNTSKPAPVDVVVGSGGGDTINLTSLPGMVTSIPTFIYGLGGNDTLSASGMSSDVFFDGGAGADKMIGGSGINHFLYGATTDSTSSAMDVIASFSNMTNVIDLTGLGTALNYAGSLGTSLAADSVGWKVSGRNTYVYVNTSGASEALGGTNMMIDLQGKITLSSTNFLHA
jgi:hypothetical protein